MKTIYAVVLCVLLLLLSACAQKVNDPADVQVIKKSCDDYLKACNAKDASAVAALMTDKAVFSDLNVPVAVGKEAVQKPYEFELFPVLVERDGRLHSGCSFVKSGKLLR